tara:strand:+ start:1059 stop:1217 length:159 start_codon:yes stop_codon:yes gene_type:complete
MTEIKHDSKHLFMIEKSNKSMKLGLRLMSVGVTNGYGWHVICDKCISEYRSD